MATARGPIPNRPPRRIALPSVGRIARAAALALIAALIGWLAHSPGTKTATRTVTQPAGIYQDTLQGAILAAAAVASNNLTDHWSTTLGYRIASFTPSAATLETVTRVLPRVKRRHTIWIGWTIHLAYRAGRWQLDAGRLDPTPNTPPFWTSPPAVLREFRPWPPA